MPGRAERFKPPPETVARLRREGVDVRSDDTVSRRQMENVKAERVGWRSWSEYQRVAKTEGYYRATIGARREGESFGLESDLSQDVAAVRRQREAGDVDTSADGPLARWLVYMGYRDPDATYRVGETDSAKQG